MRTTALEILSEPLSLLLFIAASALAVLAPTFHCHQFGESTRMARDAGLSALFMCGGALAVFGTIRSWRREIESGTLQMALAHPVSRKAFFLAKTAGAFLAYLVFALATSAVVALVVNGAEIGGIESARKGDISRIWGPSLVLAVASFMMPVVIGGLLNRFARCRFTLSAFAFALAVPLASLGYRPNAELLFRLAPVMVTLVVHAAVLLSASAAFAVRWKANGAASAVGLLFLAALPFAGNYYLADALSKGGSVSWGYVGFATLGALPALVAFLLLGAHMISTRDPA